MKLVPIEEIPKAKDIEEIPTGNLLEVYKVCKRMEILCDMEKGVGLSAFQVGIPWKLFIIKSDGTSKFNKKNDYDYFVNCEYEGNDKERSVSLEGCLSIRSHDGQLRFFQMKRFNEIRLTGKRLLDHKDLRLEDVNELIKVNQQGIVFQHEIDHHHGIMISDEGKEVFTW